MQSALIEQAKVINIRENIGKINLSKLYQNLRTYYIKYRTRQQLALLTDKQLSDIGITREQAAIESRKPFWK